MPTVGKTLTAESALRRHTYIFLESSDRSTQACKRARRDLSPCHSLRQHRCSDGGKRTERRRPLLQDRECHPSLENRISHRLQRQIRYSARQPAPYPSQKSFAQFATHNS